MSNESSLSLQGNKRHGQNRRSISVEDGERHNFRTSPPQSPSPPPAETADEAVQMEHDDTEPENGFIPGVDIGGQLWKSCLFVSV